MSALHIRQSDYSNLWALITICCLLQLAFGLPFLQLVPTRLSQEKEKEEGEAESAPASTLTEQTPLTAKSHMKKAGGGDGGKAAAEEDDDAANASSSSSPFGAYLLSSLLIGSILFSITWGVAHAINPPNRSRGGGAPAHQELQLLAISERSEHDDDDYVYAAQVERYTPLPTHISIANDATPTERHAANELREYLQIACPEISFTLGEPLMPARSVFRESVVQLDRSSSSSGGSGGVGGGSSSGGDDGGDRGQLGHTTTTTATRTMTTQVAPPAQIAVGPGAAKALGLLSPSSMSFFHSTPSSTAQQQVDDFNEEAVLIDTRTQSASPSHHIAVVSGAYPAASLTALVAGRLPPLRLLAALRPLEARLRLLLAALRLPPLDARLPMPSIASSRSSASSSLLTTRPNCRLLRVVEEGGGRSRLQEAEEEG